VRSTPSAATKPTGDIEYRAVRVRPNEVENAVVNLLRYFESPGSLIFCATRERVRHLYGALRERGFSVVQLSGELSQKERTDALQALRNGHARACICTDVAARGLDLPDPRPRHPRRPARQHRRPAAPLRPHRPRGPKGTSVIVVPLTKRRVAERPDPGRRRRRRMVRRPAAPKRSAPRTRRACSTIPC
jgi:ATP-dependent RNA helicase DeaD